MSTIAEFRTSINEYLLQLPPTTTSRLYSKPATCLAIFRLLPALSKYYIMTMVFTQTKLSMVDFSGWSSESGKSSQAAAFEKLNQMNIMKEARGYLQLNENFKTNMRLAMIGGGVHNSFGLPCLSNTNSSTITVDELDDYCTRTWEDILHFMVGTTMGRSPGNSIVRLLRDSQLIDDRNHITSAGFQFLLQDGNAQIWTLLLRYLETSDLTGADPVEIVHFLFMLGNLELGQDYSTAELSQTQQILLKDLIDFGILWQSKDRSRFYPTRLATTLTHDAQSAPVKSTAAGLDSVLSSSTPTDSGFVILETNYKIYAYTSSPLQIAVLDLFVDLNSRFPNMVSGQLTRNSIRKALTNGITADQVIQYLRTHAHPQMRKALGRSSGGGLSDGQGGAILPLTVVDQIRLWELEKNRLSATTGYLFRDFKNQLEFAEALRYAEDIGVLTYDNNARRMFFVSEGGVGAMTSFIRRKAEERKG